MSWPPLRELGRWGTFLVLLVLVGVSGCGSTGSVSGKVSYKGTPLKGGTVTFLSSESKPSEDVARLIQFVETSERGVIK